MFVSTNGWTWREQASLDDAGATVLAIAAGELDEAGASAWLRPFLRQSDQ